MTDDDRKLRLLRERAQELAARDDNVATRPIVARVVVVETGREAYGIPVEAIREIVKATPIAPLPGLPSHLPGVAAVRGELVSVVDLGEMNGRGRTGLGALFAILDAPQGPVALRIENVVGIRDVYEDEIADALAHKAGADSFVYSVTRDFVGLVDAPALLGNERLVFGRAAEAPPKGRPW